MFLLFPFKIILNDLTNPTDRSSHQIPDQTSSDPAQYSTSSAKKTIFGDLFGSKKDGANVRQVTENMNAKTQEQNLGKSTSNLNENKTWDGYGKFNNVPVNLEKTQKAPELTREEELREKFKYLRKFEDLEKKGTRSK